MLAHSVKLPGGTLKKGLVLGDAELQRLLDAGIQSVVVALLEADDVTEDDAASQVARRWVARTWTSAMPAPGA